MNKLTFDMSRPQDLEQLARSLAELQGHQVSFTVERPDQSDLVTVRITPGAMIPNPSQKRAIESARTKTVCIAGPGSGKTATLIERLQWCIDGGANPSGFVVITFTNAAADEIRRRLAERSHLGDCLGYCGTLHGFCLRLLQRHGHLLDFSDRITVLSEDQAEKMLERCIKEMNYRGAVKHVQEAIARGPDLALVPASPSNADLVAARFFKVLRRSNLVTFDTLLHYARLLLMENGRAVKEWTHLFVDEYQDSSDLDADIYERLPVKQWFYVGDGDQGIYSFRGGSVQHLLTLANENCAFLLEDNYRSVPEICQAADRLIQHNKARHPKHTHSTRTTAGEAGATCYMDARAEIQGIAQQINDVLDQGDCAVLLRTESPGGRIQARARGAWHQGPAQEGRRNAAGLGRCKGPAFLPKRP